MKRNRYFTLRKKKKEQDYYEVNKKQHILPYDRIYPNGYFAKNDNYSVMFELGQTETNEGGMISELRSSEFDFRIFNRNEKRYLMIYETCSGYKIFDESVQTAMERIRRAGETCRILMANERIRFLHEGYLIFQTRKSLNISDYLNNMAECAADFQDRKEDMKLQIKEENGCYALIGIHSFPDNHEQMEKCVTRLVKEPATCSSVRIFETVKDEIVRNKINELYMGIEGVLVRMKRTDRKFYDWFDLLEAMEAEETGRYTFCGCLSCICGKDEEAADKIIEKLQKDIKESGGRLAIYAAGKKKVLEQILGIGTEEGFTRIILTEEIGGMQAGTIEKSSNVPVLKKNII